MSNLFVRRAGVLVAGGSIYAGTVFLAYQYFMLNNDDHDHQHHQHLSSENTTQFSYVFNPERNEQYTRIASEYDSKIQRDETYMGINVLRRALLYFHAKGTILELAAGTGRNLQYYPNNVDRVILSDSSDKMLDQARSKMLKMKNRERFAVLQADASKLDLPDNSFDCVVDTFGLCSFDDPVVVLAEMARVCKPDGKILLLEHGRSSTWGSITKYLDKHAERHAKNWGCVWNRDLDAILKKAPLKLNTVDTWHFGTTYYVVCSPDQQKLNDMSP
eukprot:CAMPEP_0194134036 /NCGR_PEP_ID=MMETSP0152-20130528/4109_1 /TAXON_ID=1049557 /ORGANISM="Thalassiothrix antarctica, Strain L6-D1" /LENGTH=273 /DNA_ID=CAMNT_0038829561 /DNA_START=40 /DNA_END=858 /DNA_ORIENTATION=-